VTLLSCEGGVFDTRLALALSLNRRSVHCQRTQHENLRQIAGAQCFSRTCMGVFRAGVSNHRRNAAKSYLP
jgi:hypothetical protein